MSRSNTLASIVAASVTKKKKVLCLEYLYLKLVFAKTSLRLHVDALVLVNGTLKGFEYTLFANSYTVN
jgi:hypothetical protein